MSQLTALLHTENDELRLGRCLETLYACDNILIFDHASQDRTVHVALEYGAKVVEASPGSSPQEYLRLACAGWILCLDPCESLTEKLSASLFEWKSQTSESRNSAPSFSVFLRQETLHGWVKPLTAQTRLVPHDWNHWQGRLPAADPSASPLQGELLRFIFP